MKNKILTGWNIRRVIYAVMGLAIVVQSILQKEWMGLPLGGILIAMSLFAVGCAAGSCYMDNCNVPNNTTTEKEKNVVIEEIK